jgi:hypothetical protein
MNAKEKTAIFVVIIIYAGTIIIGNLVDGVQYHLQDKEVLYQIDMATVVVGFILLFVILIWRECVPVEEEEEGDRVW